MQLIDGKALFSAADILNFLECKHHTSLDLIDLQTPLPRTESSEDLQLLQDKGHAYESKYALKLKESACSYVDIEEQGHNQESKVQATKQAMRSGAEIIYQPHFRDGNLFGAADFMRKVPRPSALGTYSYEILDAKLALTPKTRFVLQLAYYSYLLSRLQGLEPGYMHVILGDQSEWTYAYKDYSKYLKNVMEQFFRAVETWPDIDSIQTYPEPCEYCEKCRWLERCRDQRIKDDHLSQVANITKLQIKRLNWAGIYTLEQLGRMDPGMEVPGISDHALEKISSQARLQLKARETGQNQWEILADQYEQKRGFARLPRPSEGDMFFDMEGNPMEEGGLEYLFGLYFFEEGGPQFKAFWAHSRSEEKRAFQEFMDFVIARLGKYPQAHIYHYADYEATALKKLMSLHATREVEVDNLLRDGKLVDLYKVVREAIRVSESSYSIKNLEHFYMEERSGVVQDAASSIVYYERWKESRDDALLKTIEDYNYDDVRSTYLLRNWLLELRPSDMLWAEDIREEDQDTKSSTSEYIREHEQRIEEYREAMLGSLSEDKSHWDKDDHIRELAWQLLDFHRRSTKPQWWSFFARMEMEEYDLIDDVECIGGVSLDPACPPESVKNSIRYTCTFPEQETKLKNGDNAVCCQNGASLRELEMDESARRVSFLISRDQINKCGTLPASFAIGPGKPIKYDVLQEAVFRFADSILAGDKRYRAIESLLRHELPVLEGHKSGDHIIDEHDDLLTQMLSVIPKLKNSHLFVQGPPGSGKTFSGSRVIVELLNQGFRVGVSSNSHKAINNLLLDVEKVAQEQDFSFRGAKKSTRNNASSHLNGKIIADVYDNQQAASGLNQLVAGTAWLFSREEMDQKLDFLFVDEAGQVSLANLVAMGTSSRNIVLLGDQMQLGQPIQGVHPGRSGESSLEYLLNGMATIPPEQGVFLGTTWRLHPNICKLISDMIYEGRLEPESRNVNQQLVMDPDDGFDLPRAGVRYVPPHHEGCSQKSSEEAEIVKRLTDDLFGLECQDKDQNVLQLGLDNILIVAPYNMQVNLLKSFLPQEARVGTVDKFQGQQAEVVIVSMATSSGDYLPRHIEFLYSRNRLNVAISRARCLAIVIASPELMTISCSSPGQVKLVNAMCWVKEYSAAG